MIWAIRSLAFYNTILTRLETHELFVHALAGTLGEPQIVQSRYWSLGMQVKQEKEKDY